MLAYLLGLVGEVIKDDNECLHPVDLVYTICKPNSMVDKKRMIRLRVGEAGQQETENHWDLRHMGNVNCLRCGNRTSFRGCLVGVRPLVTMLSLCWYFGIGGVHIFFVTADDANSAQSSFYNALHAAKRTDVKMK